jgi:hypothetical protein
MIQAGKTLSAHWPVLFVILFSSLQLVALPADISCSIRYDDNHEAWVQVHNQSQSSIVVQSITVEFRNSAKTTERLQIRCKEKCRVATDSSKDFGPLRIPKGTKDTSISDIKFSTEG